VKWCLDLQAWIVDCLLHPEDSSIFTPLSLAEPVDLESLNARLQASGNVALHLLLSSVSRAYLTTICRRLYHLDYTARKSMQMTAQTHESSDMSPFTQGIVSTDLRNAYTTIATLTNNAIVSNRIFESFLTSISASVKDAYTSAGLPSSVPQSQAQQPQQARPTSARSPAEQTMLFGGPLPAALLPAIKHIFTTLLPTLQAGIDPAKLFFHDYSLLALEPSSPTSSTDISTTSPLHQPPDTINDILTTPASSQHRPNPAITAVLAHTIDVFRRVPVIIGQDEPDSLSDLSMAGNGMAGNSMAAIQRRGRWRRCARCASVMRNMVGKPGGTVNFLIVQTRRCFCGGSWDLLFGNQVVA
jgi:mediator of RNA polymerase II transcription subunit 16